MTPEEANQLVQGVFDGIFDSLTKAAPGGRPLMASSTTVLSLMKPGFRILSSSYRNPWTPGNSNGSQASAVNTARLVDDAINLSTLYAASGRSITKMYGDIMDNVQIPTQPEDPQIVKQLNDAWAMLYRNVNVTDPDTGQVSEKTLDTPVYRDYKINQDAYVIEQRAYVQAYNAAQQTTEGRATWPLLSPGLQVPVQRAYNTWRSNFADKVEQALAIQQTSSQNALSKAFKKAQDLFNGYAANLDETGTGTGTGGLIHRVSLSPSDWFSSSSSTKWTVIDTASGSFVRNATSDFKSYGGSAGFSLGFFSIGGGGGTQKTHRHVSAETTGIRISFEYSLVTISRPWMSFHLLSTKGWNLQNLFRKGQLSNGGKANQSASLMPLLPTAFVVVRNVRISANWSRSDYDFVSAQTKASGGFGIGPFQISGGYGGASSNETYTSAFANGTIINPGVQVIGWISQIVPYCPPV